MHRLVVRRGALPWDCHGLARQTNPSICSLLHSSVSKALKHRPHQRSSIDPPCPTPAMSRSSDVIASVTFDITGQLVQQEAPPPPPRTSATFPFYSPHFRSQSVRPVEPSIQYQFVPHPTDREQRRLARGVGEHGQAGTSQGFLAIRRVASELTGRARELIAAENGQPVYVKAHICLEYRVSSKGAPRQEKFTVIDLQPIVPAGHPEQSRRGRR